MELYDINFEKKIGQGQFGIVYEAKHKLGQENLCAKVMVSYYFKQSLQFELDIMHYLKDQKHTNIVRILDIDQIEEDSQIKTIIFMEYCKDGNLQEYIEKNYQKLNLNHVLEIIQQVINGLKFLHQNLILHRDLKPANILLQNGTIKITDFSTSRFIDDRDYILKSRTGSPAYASPQIMDYQEYTSKSDIYSLGIIIYQLLFNKFPFGEKVIFSQIQSFHQKIKIKPFECPEILLEGDHQIKQALRQLINRMLRYDESDRIDWEELLQFQYKAEFMAINSYNNYQDLKFLSVTEHQDPIETNYSDCKLEEKKNQLNLQFLNSIQPRKDFQKIKFLSVSNEFQSSRIRFITNNNFDDVFIGKQTRKGLEFDPKLGFQKLTKSEKIAHVIKIFMAKSKLTQEVISIIKKLDNNQFNQFHITGLIVALNGYSVNLLLTAQGLAQEKTQYLQSIYRVYLEKNIIKAIQEFQQNSTKVNTKLSKKLEKRIKQSILLYDQDYKVFDKLSIEYPYDRLIGLLNIGRQTSQNSGIFVPYTIYLRWVNYIDSILPFQRDLKIQLLSDSRYILQKCISHIANLETTLEDVYQNDPEQIKISDNLKELKLRYNL